MKSLPQGFPAANSPKWRSRQHWDSLGYIRARSLTNPAWQRDVGWLTHVAVKEQSFQARSTPEESPFYDAIIAALRRYPRTASGDRDADASWDEVLSAIDELSGFRQEQHMAAIRAHWGADYGKKT